MSEEERVEVEAIARKRTSAQQHVVRAQIILRASGGVGVRETMRRLHITRRTVQIWRWRESSRESVLERLSDLPRSGAPAKYTPEHVCAIVAIACERLDEHSARPMTHWTQKELANEAIKRGIVESISPRAIGHFLKRCGPSTTSHTRLAHAKA